jgi:hypothetical protein
MMRANGTPNCWDFEQETIRGPPMTTGKTVAGESPTLDSSALDVVTKCIELVEQAQDMLDSLGSSMASVHVSQALETLRAFQVRIASGLD